MKRFTKSDSQWTVVWKQKVGAPFKESPEDYAAALASQWGVPIQAFDYPDEAADPRSGALLDLSPAPVAPPPPSPRDVQLAGLFEVIAADTALSQQTRDATAQAAKVLKGLA